MLPSPFSKERDPAEVRAPAGRHSTECSM
jgi:hypothetical protein